MSKTKDTKGNKEGDEDQEVLLSNRKTSQKQEMRESNSKDKNGERSTTITSQSKSLQSSEKNIVREQKQKQTGTRIEGTNIKTRHQIETTRELDREGRGEKKQWEVCQSHIISPRPLNPSYVYHCLYSIQYTFGFHLCSYSIPYITITIVLSSKLELY